MKKLALAIGLITLVSFTGVAQQRLSYDTNNIRIQFSPYQDTVKTTIFTNVVVLGTKVSVGHSLQKINFPISYSLPQLIDSAEAKIARYVHNTWQPGTGAAPGIR